MGRRLYWLFLGGVGFILGFEAAKRILGGQPHGVILLIAVLAGVIGALLAVFLQKFAIAAGGFLAGGYLLILLLKQFGITVHYQWLLFLIGGMAGALLMTVLFGWTLVVISSAIGAILVLPTLHAGPEVTNLLFLLLLALGIAIQFRLFERRSVNRSKTPPIRPDKKPW